MKKPKTRCLLRASACAGAIFAALAAGTPVFAQTAATTAAPAAGAATLPADKTEVSTVGEVVVTAQRRSERAQNVPLAITALTPKALEAAGVVNYSDIQNLAPSLHFAITGGSEIPYIRGVGAGTTQSGQELGTALYIDDVYVSSPQASDMYLNNVAGITVLSGPQGTLFGRNATAGVVQITTKAPTQTPTFSATLGYGNYGTAEGSLYISGPINDRISADLAIGGNDQTQGWGTNEFNGKDVYESSGFAVRSRWEIELAPQSHVTVIGGYSEFKTDEGYASHQLTPGQYGQDESYGTGVSHQGFYDVDLNGPNFSFTNVYSGSIKATQGLGFADFKSISGYSYLYNNAEVDYSLDADPERIELYLPATQETFSQEFQLVSKPNPSARLSWVTGIYLYHDRAGYHPLTEDVPSEAATVIYNSNQTTNSIAGYAQGTYRVTDDTNLTLGVRYTSDHRKVNESEQVSLGGGAPFPAPSAQGSVTYPGTTYRVNLDHHFTESIMAYVGYTTGFKSGFFNTQVPQLVPGSSTQELPVKPETIGSIEGGLKSMLFDHRLRLNLSAFDYRYHDLQVNAFINTTTRDTLNAGSAQIYGLDLDGEWKPVDRLTISFGAEALHARYLDFTNAPFFTSNGLTTPGLTVSVGNADGDRLPNAPEVTYTLAGTYTLPLAGGKLDATVGAYYTDKIYWDVQNRLAQPPYTLFNSEIKWTAPGGHYDIALWGKNLSNVKYEQEITALVFGDGAYPGAPLIFGVRAGVHF